MLDRSTKLGAATTTAPSQPPSTAAQLSAPVASALLAVAALSWAGNHVIARAISPGLPTWSFNFVRWTVVAVLLALLAGPALREDWRLMRRHWLILACLGALGGGIFGSLQFIGLRYTGALNMGVMNSVAPALIALSSYLIFRDRIGWLQGLGIGISLVGVLAIVSKLNIVVLSTFAFNIGDLIIVMNMALWAIYSACLRLRPKIAATSFLFALAASSAVVNLPLAVAEYSEGARLAFNGATLGALAYCSIISSLLAYLCWGRGIETLGVARAGAFLHLIPVFGVLLATTLLGEQLGVHHVIGFGLILVGVTLAVRRVAPA